MTSTRRIWCTTAWPTPWKKTAQKHRLSPRSLGPKLLIRGLQDLRHLASDDLISDRGPGDLKNFT